MSCRLSKVVKCSFAVLAACVVPFSSASADVIHVDISAVDPSAVSAVREAEAIWEARIQAYSSEVPRAILDQLGSLTISATVAPIDGPGGILGFAGPDAVITIGSSRRNFAVAVRSSMTFDLDDFPSLIADGTLVQVIAHEMGHALGFGTLFDGNDLIDPRGGFGPIEYINGQYAINGYRKDIGNPVAMYVPLEQRFGPGTALGHWIDAPPFFNQSLTAAFKKELMTGILGDFDPVTGAIFFADPFISDATWGAFADLGFAVNGVNGQFTAPRGNGTGRWPKEVGSGANPFDSNGVPPAAGLRYNLVTVKAAYKSAIESEGSGVDNVASEAVEDPYKLRRHRWAK
jgi:hypothetical protein